MPIYAAIADRSGQNGKSKPGKPSGFLERDRNLSPPGRKNREALGDGSGPAHSSRAGRGPWFGVRLYSGAGGVAKVKPFPSKGTGRGFHPGTSGRGGTGGCPHRSRFRARSRPASPSAGSIVCRVKPTAEMDLGVGRTDLDGNC